MSELTISASGFTIQPLLDMRDGPAVLRWAYSRSYLTNDNIQVQWGMVSSGFGIDVPCSIASGLVTVDQDSTLYSTDDAQDPNPLTIFISAWLLTPRGKLIQQLQIAGKTQWTVPSSLIPTTSWAEFSNYNQATTLYYYNPNYYNAPETDRQIRLFSEANYASDTHLGGVFTSVEPAVASQPIAWITDDPLVRDAIAIQGVDVNSAAPLDTQVLTYNQSTNVAEWANQNAGTGNVISNEVSSVDGEGVVFSGTGGKTIRRLTGDGLLLATSGVLSPQTATQATALLNPMVGDSGSGGTKGLAPAPAAGDAAAGKFLKADGTYAVPTGGGSVTTVSVVSANGLAGSVANPTTTPAITLSTSITGVLKGNGTAISAASAGTDYVAPGGALGTPSSGTLSNCTGLPVSTGVSGLGTGVAAALGTNVGSAGAPVVNGGALGTPSSGTLSSCTGLPISTGVSGLGTGVATFLGTPSSANLASAVTDETGSGALVFATSPALTSPQLSLTAAHSVDDTYTGITIVGLNAGATIAQWETVYLDGSSTWQLADANGTNTYPSRGMAVAAYVSTNPATILVRGTVRNDAWNWTPGGTIYLSGTAGGLTQTAPSASGDKVQQVGFALTADIAFFDFNSTYITLT